MERVQAGHGEVEGEENLCLLCRLVGGDFGYVGIAMLGIADLFGDISQALVCGAATAPGVESLADHMPRYMAFIEFVVILFGFYTQEGRAQDHGPVQKPDLSIALAL